MVNLLDREGDTSADTLHKARSLSDGSPPILSPSPRFIESEERSKDDTAIESPTTPRRPALAARGLSLQMLPKDLLSISTIQSAVPLSPKLDQATTYGSPTSVIPRRSRGLDFSRAATNLHHSTLAEQPSPESSPTMSGRGMNIPHRRSANFSTVSDSPSMNSGPSWSTMDRMTMPNSLGSVNMVTSDSSGSSSDDGDTMDADEIDESILTTPRVRSMGLFGAPQPSPGTAWMTGPSPAVSSLMKFQRARTRSGKTRRSKASHGVAAPSPKSRSPPTFRSMESVHYQGRDVASQGIRGRRESISWAANQLNISGSESEDNQLRNTLDFVDGLPSTPGRDSPRGVIRRVVTRRGNMLPKTKGFARIRAALAEEGAPIETEVRREADVVRQVRENDVEIDPSRHSSVSGSLTAQSSPMFGPAVLDALEEIPEDDIMVEPSSLFSESTLSSSFQNQALKHSKGREFWESFPDDIHIVAPPLALLPRGSSSGISDDASMNSPALSTPSSSVHNGFQFPLFDQAEHRKSSASPAQSSTPQPSGPSAADITRKVNNKRRRDDDFDPTSFKRRAVSPGMSVHNSPVMQSPLQRDVNPWGSKAESNFGAPLEKTASQSSNVTSSGRLSGSKRIGLQGMVDTNDSLMKMSIE